MVDSRVVNQMIARIAEFFCFMSDTKERRLYYQLPLVRSAPYAYQHSSIRDVATVCDILDLVQLFQTKGLLFPAGANALFEEVTKNTLLAYSKLYRQKELPDLPEGNIGDIGFYLLALEKSSRVYPRALPEHWQEIKSQLICSLQAFQHTDGSMRIFFDPSLKSYEKNVEAFYLPEALIGLMAVVENSEPLQKTISYSCQEQNRKRHLAEDTATFYANWQFQLLYHWFQKKQKASVLELDHLDQLISALKGSSIANEPFENSVATVEVACYMEGLVHVKRALAIVNNSAGIHETWFNQEIDRSLLFLKEIQAKNLNTIHGGFVHSLFSHEARIDVAGHVFGGLQLL